MKILGLLAMTMAVGVAAPPNSYPARGDTGHQCDAGKARALAGRTRSPAVEREARRLSGAGIVRWIPEGAMVTMDYRPDRIDLRLDGKGRIVKVDCG
ncbi:MAG TPA: I78 family peptidase inhibitor [Allosphingosinicella sp.]|nr:I78 family peptidase inhibitor [Allosphingosinicella sp.]